ncbi:MAG: hypothetical protein H7A28_05560 [Thermotogae bacterium]|nr:hypothetical protein [Thermotogota bacterium]
MPSFYHLVIENRNCGKAIVGVSRLVVGKSKGTVPVAVVRGKTRNDVRGTGSEVGRATEIRPPLNGSPFAEETCSSFLAEVKNQERDAGSRSGMTKSEVLRIPTDRDAESCSQ